MTENVTYSKAVSVVSEFIDKTERMNSFDGSILLAMIFNKDKTTTMNDLVHFRGYKGDLK